MRRDALAFLAGITAIQFAPWLPDHGPWLVFAPLLLGPVLWRAPFRWLLFLVAGVTYAMARAGVDLEQVLPSHREPLQVDALIVIDSLVEWRGSDAAFSARVERMDVPLSLRRVRVDWRSAPRGLHTAQRWRLPLRLKRARGVRNPGAFDAESRWLQEGIGALASVTDRFIAQPLADASGFRAGILRLRERVSVKLAGSASGSASAGVITGLAVGDTARISQEQWGLFRATGITHLMAISGAHVGMFGLFAAAVTRRAWKWLRTAGSSRGSHALCALAAALGAGGYALLAGFSVPSQRTALMIAVAGAARLRVRQVSSSRTLALALIAVLILDPAASIQAGFWLSFGTVAFLLASGEGTWPASSVLSGLRAQIGVSCLLLPPTLYFFGQASLVSPVVNLVAVPVTGLLLVPAIIAAAVLAGVLPELSRWMIERIASGLDALWPWLSGVAAWPMAQHFTPTLPLPMALCSVAGALLVTLASWPWRLIGMISMFGALAWRAPAPAPGGFEFTLLDAGDATLATVLTRESVLVYFAGAGSALAPDVGATVLLPFLRSRGRERIDLLVVSRAEGAHAAGIDAVFRELPVTQVIAGGDAQAPCDTGQRFDRDGLRVDALSVPLGSPGDASSACGMWVSGSGVSVLLFADLDAAGELILLSRQVLHPVTIALVPAHGSHRASTAQFIAAVQPRWALVAAAHLNRFDYPRPEVLARWAGAGAQVRQVSQEGAMTLTVAPAGLLDLPPGERIRHRHYWTVD